MTRHPLFRRVETALTLATAGWGLWTARFALLHWGATDAELHETMPGDEVLPAARRVVTRAITIDAPPEAVWPWIAQLGQGRGGLYSHDWLENLVGCDIHSVDRIVPELQEIRVGDEVRLHPRSALTVVSVDPGEHLLLRPGPADRVGELEGSPFDFTWAFVVWKHPGGRTRLVVRERYAAQRPWAVAIVEPLAVVSAVMGIKQLHGIRDRATSTVGA